MPRVRPTLRCLSQDLSLPIPPQTIPLDEVAHPLIEKSNEQFASSATRRERISAIDDQQLFKVKIGRWRGAMWEEPDLGWLVAAGVRESGSPEDFYRTLEASAIAARRTYNASHRSALSTRTYVGDLLPDEADRRRYHAEAEVRSDRALEATVRSLLRASLHDGQEHRTTIDTFALGIQVRADDGHETWVAIRITGSVPDDLTASVFDLIPGCGINDWEYYGRMPGRAAEPGEDVWFNLMDPVAAAKLLEDDLRT